MIFIYFLVYFLQNLIYDFFYIVHSFIHPKLLSTIYMPDTTLDIGHKDEWNIP